MRKLKIKRRFWALFAAIVLSLGGWFVKENEQRTGTYCDGTMAVHFIDVGQGDAILLTADDVSVLIDAGPDSAEQKLISYIQEQQIETLDIVVGTHPHEDHIGGLDGVIQTFTPETIVMPKVSSNTRTFERVLDAVEAQNKKIKAAQAGLVLEKGGLTLEFLSPEADKTYSETNNYSAVIRICYNGQTFLFTGDAETEIEEHLLEQYDLSGVNVLKAGHHGSSTSSSKQFIDSVSPEYAVIMVGAGNSYGHPSEQTLKTLAADQVQVLRTDLCGTIVFYVDEDGNLRYETEREE